MQQGKALPKPLQTRRKRGFKQHRGKQQPQRGHAAGCSAAETPSKHDENEGFTNSNTDGNSPSGDITAWCSAAETPSKHGENEVFSNTEGKQQPQAGHAAWCSAAETPSKHDENEGFSNTESKQKPQAGHAAWCSAAETPPNTTKTGVSATATSFAIPQVPDGGNADVEIAMLLIARRRLHGFTCF
jgi:hypothetical protein